MSGSVVAGAPTTAELIRRARPSRQETGLRGRLVVAVLVLASFGPYAVGGLRTEQLAVYGLLASVGFIQLFSLQITPLPVRAWVMFGVWATYVAVAIASGLGQSRSTRWPPGDLLAGADNLVGPLAVMLLVWSTVTLTGADRALRLAARLTAVCMAANGVLALVMTRVDLSDSLRPFWASEGGTATAENAVTNGRFSGVFNHPAEAGIAYGVAVLCAWYLWRERPRPLYLALTPIVVGGLLTVSKVFILAGLPVLVWLLLSGRRTRLTSIFVAVVAALGIAQSGLLDHWIGADRFGAIFRPTEDQSLLMLFSAGRFGGGTTTLGTVVGAVTDVSPWFGVGISGLTVPYDNAWVEALVVAGLFGVLAYTVVLVLLAVLARGDRDAARRRFVTGLVLVIAAGSVGVPALTVNRSATLAWVLISLVVLAQREASQLAARTITL